MKELTTNSFINSNFICYLFKENSKWTAILDNGTKIYLTDAMAASAIADSNKLCQLTDNSYLDKDDIFFLEKNENDWNCILKCGLKVKLPTDKVDEIKNSAPQLPINIVANPTLEGDESVLEGVELGDTKYAMPSGGGGATLYEHNIQITNYTSYVCIKLVNNKIIMTISDLYNYLASLNPTGGSENRIPIVCTGVIKDSNYWIVVSGIYTSNGTSSPQAVIFFGYEKNNYKWYSSSMNISGWDLIDTVYDMEGNLV